MSTKFIGSSRSKKTLLAWMSVSVALASLSLLSYLKWKAIFSSGNFAASLQLASLVLAVFSFVIGGLAAPRWQGIVAMTISCIVLYFILFTPVYFLS